MAKFHLIPIVLGAAIGVGVYVVSKYLAQDEESEHIVDDSAFDDSEAPKAPKMRTKPKKMPTRNPPQKNRRQSLPRTRNSPHRLRNLPPLSRPL
ncbi:hypothetical protein [Gemmiger qucibialis]|uniref:hypothetical protein n=1 Tax=Gemmiger qucibialis TaxID=2997294 RepID=UPI0022E98B24|nr:hypothetical protein [Gemmiger qucibialis]